MTATTKKLYCYSIDEYQNGDYHHLTIRIAKKEYSPHIDHDDYPVRDSVKITYQAIHTATPVRWYASALELDGGSNLDKYHDGIKLARRACPSGNLDDLDEILSTLAHVADYVINDPRTSNAVTALYPPDYDCYLDDYATAGYTYCYVNVLARNAADAQRAIMRKFAEGYSHTSDFLTWILAGRPVKKAYRHYRSEPDYRTIEERINCTERDECAYLRQWQLRNNVACNEMTEQRLTVYAANKNGKWIIVDNGGNTLQDGYEYDTCNDAREAARQLWPANSVWMGRPDGNDWSIVIS